MRCDHPYEHIGGHMAITQVFSEQVLLNVLRLDYQAKAALGKTSECGVRVATGSIAIVYK